MKERITFIHASDDAYDPGQLAVNESSLRIKNLRADREHRLTFNLQEIPQEIWRDALRQSNELHIRWTSGRNFIPRLPFVSRLSPGFHLFYTPLKNRAVSTDLTLCPLLRKVFGDSLQCTTPEESFIQMPNIADRVTISPSYQYYQLLPDLKDFGTYIREKICPALGDECSAIVTSVESADYVDIDYDTVSHSLTVRIYRSGAPLHPAWTEKISLRDNTSSVEVGILASEKSTQPEPEMLALGGFLTVLGEDTKPNPTFFHFPSRHHIAPTSSSYRASFLTPTGLHPTLRLSFPSTAPPRDFDTDPSSCSLHAHLTLPSVLFPDKYQLSAPLLLASKNLRAVRAVYGEMDLEAPDWAVSRWGSGLLMEIVPKPEGGAVQGEWNVDIPLHLRYLAPAPGGLVTTEIPWPVVFWTCAAEGEKLRNNPFDRVGLGYDGLFAPGTIFYHVQPKPDGRAGSGTLVESLVVPVLEQDRTAWLEGATAVVIVAGLGWVLWKLAGVVWGGGMGGGNGKGSGGGRGRTDKKMQ